MSISDKLVYLSGTKNAIKSAIEAKGVTVGTATFREYADKIGSIEPVCTGDYLVTFIDYDGTILKQKYVSSGASVTAPTPPAHTNLTFYGWNNTATSVTSDLTIGACYNTTDNKTHLKVKMTAVTGLAISTFTITKSDTSTLTIDWGDGNTNTSSASGAINIPHTYATAGEYDITLWISSGSGTYDLGAVTYMFGISTNYFLREVNFASGTTTVKPAALANSKSLHTITFSSTMTSLGASAVALNSFLNTLIIPDNITTLGNNSTSGVTLFEYLSLPARNYVVNGLCSSYYGIKTFNIYPGATVIYPSQFNNCYLLKSLKIPTGVYLVDASSFNNCFSLKSLEFPSTLTNISANAFYGCYSIVEYKFNSTTPPVLQNINAFTSINGICKIKVPAASLAAYQTATNWSTYANYMEGF